MKYCTDDGKKIFDTEEEYFAYERKIKEEMAAKELRDKEKKERLDEIKALCSTIDEKIRSYAKDYNESIKITNMPETFDLFDFLW